MGTAWVETRETWQGIADLSFCIKVIVGDIILAVDIVVIAVEIDIAMVTRATKRLRCRNAGKLSRVVGEQAGRRRKLSRCIVGNQPRQETM